MRFEGSGQVGQDHGSPGGFNRVFLQPDTGGLRDARRGWATRATLGKARYETLKPFTASSTAGATSAAHDESRVLTVR